jgi:hypothetical protein
MINTGWKQAAFKKFRKLTDETIFIKENQQKTVKFGHEFLKQGHSDYYVTRFCHRVANNDL